MFIHIAESQVKSAPWKAAVGWYQVTVEKMTRWTKNVKEPNKQNAKQGSSIAKILGKLLRQNILD